MIVTIFTHFCHRIVNLWSLYYLCSLFIWIIYTIITVHRIQDCVLILKTCHYVCQYRALTLPIYLTQKNAWVPRSSWCHESYRWKGYQWLWCNPDFKNKELFSIAYTDFFVYMWPNLWSDETRFFQNNTYSQKSSPNPPFASSYHCSVSSLTFFWHHFLLRLWIILSSKIAFIWDETPCSLVNVWHHFGECASPVVVTDILQEHAIFFRIGWLEHVPLKLSNSLP